MSDCASYGPVCRRPLMKRVGTDVMPIASASSMSSRTRPVTSGEVEVPLEPLDVQPELARQADDVGRTLVLLVGEQAALELEELALQGCRLGRLRAGEGVRVVLGERRVAPDVAELSPSSLLTSWIEPEALRQKPHWKSPYSTIV